MRVTGHTCDLGSDNYNMGLSEKRAESAHEYLKANYETFSDKIVSVLREEVNDIGKRFRSCPQGCDERSPH